MFPMLFFELFLGALLAFAATAAGAALVLHNSRLGRGACAGIMAFSSGVMGLAAVEMFLQSHAASGDSAALAGLALGLVAFVVLDRILPHAHNFMKKGAKLPPKKKKAALLAGTITLHNIPEGFAIASAFATSPPLGWLVAVSIAVQDFPEGFIVSAPLCAYKVKSKSSFFCGAFSGFVEFMAAIVGFLFLSTMQAIAPFALAFSAGAMAYVTAFELLPDAFSVKGKILPTAAFFAGVAATFILSRILAA